jgi:diguanylate cyclase (GGDEF)-like protein/PAS domain S-box-containing protein
MLEHVPVVVYSCAFDERSTLLSVSPHITELTGRTPEELLADDEEWYRCIHPDDVERVRAEEKRQLTSEEPFDASFRIVHRDGRVFHVWERDSLVRDADGIATHSQGVLIDVTPLRAAEESMRHERDRARQYLDLAGTVVAVIDMEHRIRMFNRAGHELLGYTDGELIGLDYFDTCIPERNRDRLRAGFVARVGSGEIEGEYDTPLLCRDGSERELVWHSAELYEDGRPAGLLTSGIDVTERRQAQEQIAYLAYHDSLTGLPNRAKLRDHLELALARATRHDRSVALLFLDLDDFKLVNDGLGHAAGDELLRAMATRLRKRLRDEDLLAREGGDEFLILLGDLDDDPQARAVAVGEDLVEALRAPFRLGQTEFEVNGSVGISVFPGDAADAEALLAHADNAMYAAKAAGRGQVRLFEGRRHRSSERLQLSHRLRRAIEGDELLLYWQPIVTVADGGLTGMEALVRWNDPQRGLVSACDFIDEMDHFGLLEALDEWVVAAFTAQRREWQAEGLDPHVGFNLGPRALTVASVDRLLERLAEGGSFDRLTIEISESQILRDDAVVRAAVDRLVGAGVTLALDDFGVAYSSLSRLRDLPAKWIKVDRSFLAGVPGDRAATAVFEAIVQLVQALQLRAIVEGVESPGQASFLRRRGVEYAQGYFYGRPSPADELHQMLLAAPERHLAETARS